MLIFASISKFIVLYKLFKTLKIMKKIFTFAFALVCAIAANAQTVTLSGSASELKPVTLTAGQKTEVYVYMDAPGTTFCGYQGDLYLPEGVKIFFGYDEDSEENCFFAFNGSIVPKKHTTQAGEKEGFYTLLQYNSALTQYKATSGDLIKLTLVAEAGFVGGTASLKNQILTDPKTSIADATDIVIAEATGINDVKAIDVNAPKYNFQGVQVKDAKMFIQNGKKYIK